MQENNQQQSSTSTGALDRSHDWLYGTFQLVRRSVLRQDKTGVEELRQRLHQRLVDESRIPDFTDRLDGLVALADRAIRASDADLADLLEMRIKELFPRRCISVPAPVAAPSVEVLQLLNHIEDVLDDAAWSSIDTKLWNAVTRLYAQPVIETAQAAAPEHTNSAAVSPKVVVWMREGADSILHNFRFDAPDSGPWIALGRIEQSASNESRRADCDGGACGLGGYCDECPTQSAGLVISDGAQNFACYLIDHCEGNIVSEAFIQQALIAMLKNSQYNENPTPVVRTGPGTPSARLAGLLTALNERFPGVVDEFSSAPPEPLLLEALDAALSKGRVMAPTANAADVLPGQIESAAALHGKFAGLSQLSEGTSSTSFKTRGPSWGEVATRAGGEVPPGDTSEK